MRRQRTCARSAPSIQNGARNRQVYTSSQPGYSVPKGALALDALALTYRRDAPDAGDVLAALETLTEIASRVLDVSDGLTLLCDATLDAARGAVNRGDEPGYSSAMVITDQALALCGKTNTAVADMHALASTIARLFVVPLEGGAE